MSHSEKYLEAVVMVEPEAGCIHEPAPDSSGKMSDERKMLQKAIKNAYKAQKLLNKAIKRLEAGEKEKRKYKRNKRHSSSSSSTSSSSSSGTSSSSSSSSSDSDVVDLTKQAGEPKKRHHGRKHHHGRRNRRGRDRSRSRSHSRECSRGRSRGHSRGHSRGRCRDYSRASSRDRQLCQFTRFFRGASLPTAPSIRQCHHYRRSHIRPENTCSSHVEVKWHSRPRSRSHSRENHGKHGQKKHHKNKDHKKGKKKHHHYKENDEKERRHHHEHGHRKRDRSHCRNRSNSRGHSRDRRFYPYFNGIPGFIHTGGLSGRPSSAFSDVPPPPPRHMQGRAGDRHSRDRHRHGYTLGPADAFNWHCMSPKYCSEKRDQRRRAHSVPGH